jgi:hypothetical protein
MPTTTKANPSDLGHFTGTEGYHRYFPFQFKGTDGVKYLSDGGMHWFVVDVMAFCQELIRKNRASDFMTAILNVKDGKASLVITDGNKTTLKQNKYEFTDATEGEYKLFITDGVVLLASEY